jgi:capsular polysaccharide biosynthesis protein
MSMSASASPSLSLTLPLGTAARATGYFEKSCLFQRQSEIRLDEAFLHQAAGVSFQAAGVTAAVRNYAVENVVLDADTLLLLRDGLVIPETGYFVPEGKRAQLTVDQASLVRLEAGEDVIIGYNNAHWGYQHWLTQCLPAIDWSLRQQRTRGPRLLLPKLAPWQEDFIRILGYDAVPRLIPAAGTQYLLPHAEYSEFLNGSTSFEICLSTRDTARRVLNALPSFPPPHKVLYVPCANPYYGSIGNEAEVIDLLQRRGVFIVDQQRLSTADRINLFRHADVVMGPLGQGLADVVFCKPGALLWEWMPAHHQNASYNRLAQAAEVDYWGDIFESRMSPGKPGQWHIDAAVVSRRLSEISNRLALRAAGAGTKPAPAQGRASPDISVPDAARKPIDELMLAFESLGDNCEFGLVQRRGGAEPLGLLRFAGIFLPIEIRLEKLTVALERKFEGLGAADTMTVYLAGEPGQREFLVRESAYDLMYHTYVSEGEAGLEDMRERESKRLRFLRRKLLEDLEAGEKIWIWKSAATLDANQVQPLLHALRALGPNTLLWVVEGDERHRPGSIEQLDRDFIKGYIERFAPYDNAPDIRPASWFEVCQKTYDLCYTAPLAPQNIPSVQAQPARSAMEFLASNQANVPTDPNSSTAITIPKPPSWLRRLFRQR